MTEKQKINDIDFITIEEAAEMTRGTRVTGPRDASYIC